MPNLTERIKHWTERIKRVRGALVESGKPDLMERIKNARVVESGTTGWRRRRVHIVNGHCAIEGFAVAAGGDGVIEGFAFDCGRCCGPLV
jgi:hypothetical protein